MLRRIIVVAVLGAVLLGAAPSFAASSLPFSAPQTYGNYGEPGSMEGTGVAIGDVTGDGRPDVVTVGQRCCTVAAQARGGIIVFAHSSTGQTFTPTEFDSNDITYAAVTTAVLGGRGAIIAVGKTGTQGAVTVMVRNAANTGFDTTYYTVPGQGNLVSVAMVDVNNDDKPDIAATDNAQTPGHLITIIQSTQGGAPFFNTGADTGGGGLHRYAAGNNPGTVVAGDFADYTNGNGNLGSVAVLNRGDDTVSVYAHESPRAGGRQHGHDSVRGGRHDPDHAGIRPVSMVSPGPAQLPTGRSNLVVANELSSDYTVMTGTSAETFGSQTTLAADPDFGGVPDTGIAWGYLDDDQLPDLVTSEHINFLSRHRRTSSDVAVPHLRKPSIDRVEQRDHSGRFRAAVAVADLNGDGRGDIVSTGGDLHFTQIDPNSFTVPARAAPRSCSSRSARCTPSSRVGQPDVDRRRRHHDQHATATVKDINGNVLGGRNGRDPRPGHTVGPVTENSNGTYSATITSTSTAGDHDGRPRGDREHAAARRRSPRRRAPTTSSSRRRRRRGRRRRLDAGDRHGATTAMTTRSPASNVTFASDDHRPSGPTDRQRRRHLHRDGHQQHGRRDVDDHRDRRLPRASRAPPR